MAVLAAAGARRRAGLGRRAAWGLPAMVAGLSHCGRTAAPFRQTASVVVGIAGGTGAGKTLARGLCERLGHHRAALLSHDSYYRDLSHLPPKERAATNMDHPDALDIRPTDYRQAEAAASGIRRSTPRPVRARGRQRQRRQGPGARRAPPAARKRRRADTALLAHQLRELRAGRPVSVPGYDFAAFARRPDAAVLVQPRPVLVVEGILVLAEGVLRSLMDRKVFVDAAPALRLARRRDRDVRERGREPDAVDAQYAATVRPMHQQFVEPSREHADLVVSGGEAPRASLERVLARLEELMGPRWRE